MGDDSGLSGWLIIITSFPKGVREEDVTLKVEQQSDTAWERESVAGSEDGNALRAQQCAWKRQGNDSPTDRASGNRKALADILISAQWGPFQTSDLQSRMLRYCVVLGHQLHGDIYQMQ